MPLLVAAIDFGTTYSGWAFSFKHEFESNPTKCSAKNWTGGQLVSLKGPTCALIKPDGKTLDSFGYDAEENYASLVEQNKHSNWYYFRRFKMKLFREGGLHRNTLIEDEAGNKLAAQTVFALSIKYLKDDLITSSGKQVTGAGISNNDIQWVLTVPAIWNDAAKQFMREAAEKAGISSDKLSIALEPEAASLYCRHLPVEKSGKEQTLASFGPGKKYMVLDAGGGTVDITVHEVLAGAQLKELNKASGGAWGGTQVDLAFHNFLSDIVDPKVIIKFKDTQMEDYVELFRDFEIKKRSVGPDTNKVVTVRIPAALTAIIDELKHDTLTGIVKASKHASKVTVVGDRIRVDPAIFKQFFAPSIDSIVNHVKNLLREPTCQRLDAIVMVGGFSESPLLQDAVKTNFKNLRTIVPDEAGLAVLKGAVIYGHKPTSITARVSKYTYGTDVTEEFDVTKHKMSQMQIVADEVRCLKVFCTLVKNGQTLEIGKAQGTHTFVTASENQTAMGMDIYAALDKVPEYVDDDGCYKIGTFSIPVSGRGKGREVIVRMIFGGTEIEVECTEVSSGKMSKLKVDFL